MYKYTYTAMLLRLQFGGNVSKAAVYFAGEIKKCVFEGEHALKMQEIRFFDTKAEIT